MPSDLAAWGEAGIGGFSGVGGFSAVGGFSGGSTTTGCGRCGLRADLTRFDGLLASFFDGFSGAMTGVAPGDSSANGPRSAGGSFSDSTQRKKASFNSSIAAHPARPKLAHKAIRTSATRAQARVDVLVLRRVGELLR